MCGRRRREGGKQSLLRFSSVLMERIERRRIGGTWMLKFVHCLCAPCFLRLKHAVLLRGAGHDLIALGDSMENRVQSC